MYIVHMINALRVGGAEKLVATFAQAVQGKDVQVTVITLRPNLPEAQAQVEAFGAEVVAFNHRKLWAPRRFLDLVGFLRREKPDVIHTHLTMATLLGAAAGVLAGIPVVTSLHNTNMKTSRNPVLSRLETFALRHLVREVIAVGWGTAQAQQPRLRHRQVQVIPNAVPIPEAGSRAVRQRTRAALVGDSDRLILLSVGRLEPQKGVFDLLESFAQVHHRCPNTCLVMAGSGSLEDQVRAKVASLGLGDAVQLLGLRQDIPDLLAASDLFVSAAHWEGLPVASLEAMAAGLPSVVTAVGDLPRLVVPGTGLLVEPEDPPALAKGIERMLADAGLRQESGAAARDHIKAHYSAAAWADRLLAVYSQVAASEGSGRERK